MKKWGTRTRGPRESMRDILVVLIFSWIFTLMGAAQAQVSEIAIWPKGLPSDAKSLSPEVIESAKQRSNQSRIAYVETPSLSVYLAPKAQANGCAVIICPGGGYSILAWPKEGLEVAEWFNSIGVSAFVLKYRVPRRDPQRIHWEPMQDVQRAIRLVRSRAEEWTIDPNRIGVLGFSAGGHLSVMAGVRFNEKAYPRVDQIDDISCRPNFICPIYAAYLADGYRDDVAELGELVTITSNTPPVFMAVTWDDKMRGAQAALMLAELKKKNVPAELHVFTQGGHGYGMRDNGKPVSAWKTDLAAWLASMQFIPPR